MDGQIELPGTGIGPGVSPDELIEQDILDPTGDKWPPLLAQMVTATEAGLIKAGATTDQAAEFAVAAVLAIGDFVGGKLVYIPRGTRLVTALKHARAWRMWKGNNIEEIMAYLGVTQVRAYAVLAQQRALHKAKVQRSLFDGT